MAHPKRRQSKMRTAKRRTHDKAATPTLAKCSNCGAWHVYHLSLIHIWDAHPACRNVRDFIRLAVDADAVSYTHLDVYKRQILHFTPFQIIDVVEARTVIPLRFSISIESVMAVSYTHLDVYKRQGQYAPCPCRSHQISSRSYRWRLPALCGA